MKLVAQLISVTLFSIYLTYILKKERERKDLQIVNRKENMMGTWEVPPFLSKDNCLSEGTGYWHL